MPHGRTAVSERRREQVLAGNQRKAIFLLALPVLCEQLLTFCVGLVDTYLSGTLSTAATTAVGLGAYVGWLASIFFGLVGTGTTALVARHWGAGEFDHAHRITNRSIALAAVLGTVFYGLIFTAAPTFARMIGMDPATADVVVRYLRLDGIGHLLTSLTLVGAAALRGAGDMRSPMVILSVVNVTNVLISATLVFGLGPFPAMDIDGIIIGTVSARFVGGLLMLGLLSSGLSGLVLQRRELRVRGNTVRRILRIGGPAALDGAFMWGGQLVFLTIIGHLTYGPESATIFAAHIVGIRVEAITYLPAIAWGYASATMIGQSLGAGDKRRALRSGHESALQCGLLATLIMVTFYAAAPAIFGLMHENPAVAEAGVPAFRLLSLFQVPLVVSIIYVLSLRGSGDTRYPLLITIIGVLGFRLPVAYVCGVVLQGGLIGAWAGMCADILVRSVLASIRYARGRWMETVV